ncbi:MAG TPA: hypothetical protein VF557_15340 [Jatrophihabitans sp.]|jgi:hypothetical protein|uniref:hypothetical protein n=1 Tax=Jatrophihabitans sp. TaxID=1932789 RepID=UPI002EF59E3D
MALFGRRLRVPAGLRGLLAPDERLLAMAEDGPAAVAATQFGLWLPVGPASVVAEPVGPGSVVVEPVVDQAEPASAAPGWRRIGWEHVVKATWGEDGLQVIEGVLDDAGVVTDLPALTLRLAEPRNLPAVVKTRVEASIARWEQVRVPGGTGRVVARRRTGMDGLLWTARLDSGTPDSDTARAALLDYLDRVARQTSDQPIPS